MQAAPTVSPEQDLARSEPPLRVALLGYRSNPFSGGQGVYVKYLSKALAAQGHRVDVISGEPYPDLDPSVRLIKLPGLNLFAVEDHVTALRPRHLLSPTDFFEWLSMLSGGFPEPYTFGRRVVAYLKRHRHEYDVVHDNQSLCYGLLRLEALGFPLLATIHHPIHADRDIALAAAEDWKHRLLIRRWHHFLRMQTKVVRRLRHIVTVSESSRRDIGHAFRIDPSSIHLVYNGIDTEDFAPLPDVERGTWRIMATASADQPLKGLEYLLRAIALLVDRYPRIELVVVGKPKEDGPTEKLIGALGLGPYVQFRHGIATADIRRLYAEAAIAVVPSVYEGFGLPAGEAMACGVPVVATNGGALAEVVGDAGVVVPTKDPGAMARAIETLLTDPARRRELSLRGRLRIETQFDWRHAATEMAALYREVMASRREPMGSPAPTGAPL